MRQWKKKQPAGKGGQKSGEIIKYHEKNRDSSFPLSRCQIHHNTPTFVTVSRALHLNQANNLRYTGEKLREGGSGLRCLWCRRASWISQPAALAMTYFLFSTRNTFLETATWESLENSDHDFILGALAELTN